MSRSLGQATESAALALARQAILRCCLWPEAAERLQGCPRALGILYFLSIASLLVGEPTGERAQRLVWPHLNADRTFPLQI